MQNQFLKLNIKHYLRGIWTVSFFFDNLKKKCPKLTINV